MRFWLALTAVVAFLGVMAGWVCTQAHAAWHVEGVPVYPEVSYWERDVRGAPLDNESDRFVSWWASKSSKPYVNLVGNVDGTIKDYSFATCYGRSGSPIWTLRNGNPPGSFQVRCSPNMGSVLKPAGGDKELTFFDLVAGVQARITGSCNPTTRVCTSIRNWRNWRQTGPAAGLDFKYNPACPSCRGHRGLDTSTFGFRFQEVKDGAVEHLVKLTVPSTVNGDDLWVFPYVDGEQGKTGIVPEGSRVRLKQASYDRLKTVVTNPAARTMLDSLYLYGSIVSDSGGSGINMKLENPAAWNQLGITPRSLNAVRVTDFEFVQRGWGRP